MIGIKIADGSFYPILDESTQARKKLLLTTVKDMQSEVNIDLYRANGEGIEAAEHIGRIRLENIEAKPKGEADIELILSSDERGNINAQASDVGGEEQQSLSLALEEHEEGPVFEEPDFALEDSYDLQSTLRENGYNNETKEEEQTSSKTPRSLFFMIGGLALLLIALLLVFFLVIRPIITEDAAVQITAAEEEEEPEALPPAEKEDAEGPAGTEKQPLAPAGEQGVWYKIAPGDTLWDLSESFYFTPWRFDQIADQNEIKNPDLILAGEKIYIPDVECNTREP